MKRRSFLIRLFQFIGGGLALGVLNQVEGASRGRGVFKVGKREDYPPGTVRHLIFDDAFIVSDEEGIYALSSVCTHHGGPLFKTDQNDAFVCRRHHSRFDLTGRPLRGPATQNLPWLKLTVDRKGDLYLHRLYRGETGAKILHKNPKPE